MGSQSQNERKFQEWEELPNRGRIYSRTVQGRNGWFAVYRKRVSADETTEAFWQEIFNDAGKLVEIHEKFPVDKGHRKV